MSDLAKQLGQALSSFNERRVISQKEIDDLKQAITLILAANKQGLEVLTKDTQKQLKDTLASIESEHNALLEQINGDLKASKAEIEQLTKQTNDRAFKRLQTLISKIEFKRGEQGPQGEPGPKGDKGDPGRNGTELTAEEVRDKLETLKDTERLDASAIKGLPQFIKTVKSKTKQMMVGGIRFLEELADVSIIRTNKRQDMLIQYDTTNNRFQDGISITVSDTAPSDPKVNDIWLDIS